MHDWITQVGAGGAFLLIALKMFLDWSKVKRNGHEPVNSEQVASRISKIENEMGLTNSNLARAVALLDELSRRVTVMDERQWKGKG